MKKISLKTLSNKEILSRTELKSILGGSNGSGFASCSVTCKDDKKTTISADCGYGVSCATDENNVYCGGTVSKTCPK